MTDFYEIASADLAAWLRSRPKSWWTVDGDRFLMSELEFPCSSEALAEALLGARQSLLVRSETKPVGERLAVADLERIAQEAESDPALQLRWQGQDRDWLLVEDREVAELEREGAAQAKPR